MGPPEQSAQNGYVKRWGGGASRSSSGRPALVNGGFGVVAGNAAQHSNRYRRRGQIMVGTIKPISGAAIATAMRTGSKIDEINSQSSDKTYRI